MHGRKKITRTTKKRWERYALPEGFKEREYPKDLNCHTISKNTIGRKNLDYGYQTTSDSTNTQRNKSNGDAKFAITPHRCSTVLVKHFTQRFHRKLGRTRKSIRKKFLFDIQVSCVTRRSQILHAEEWRNPTFIHIAMEYNKKLHGRHLRREGSRCFLGWSSLFGSRGRIRENKA
jgi:hypothetical protein